MPSPDNYILGSGDRLMLDLSGVQDRQQELLVSRDQSVAERKIVVAVGV